MKEFIAELSKIQNLSNSKRDVLSTKYKRPGIIQPLGAFGTFANMAVASIEAADNYAVLWNRPQEQQQMAAFDEAMRRKIVGERNERLTLVTKSMFVWSMSSAEFAMRTAMQMHPDVIPEAKGKEIKFAKMIGLSADAGFIPDDARPLWFGANVVRNKMVHNNAIGDRDETWTFSSDLTVTMRKGRVVQGTLKLFPALTHWLVSEYAVLCDNFLAAATARTSSLPSSVLAP